MHGTTPDSAVEYMRFVLAAEFTIYSACSKPGFGLYIELLQVLLCKKSG